MIRPLLSLLFCATLALAEPVFFSRSGKTFHQRPSCSALARSRAKYSADRAAATAHGLKPCSRCYRVAGSRASDKLQGWAQEAK